MSKSEKQGSIVALSPLFVFIFLFIGTGIFTGDFSNMPLTVAVIISATYAMFLNRKESLAKKVEVFTKSAGHSNIILMVVIFVLAGAFAGVAKGMGAVESTVNLGLSLVPGNLLMVGLFLVGCFISVAMGTSMGTVVALAPIGLGIADETGIPVALALATVVGGAMFGDNLSMISDTTIAAVRTQNTKMKDKFKVNFFIVLPGAILTAIILGVITSGYELSLTGDHPYDVVKVLPYLVVLIAALVGVDVLIVLLGGTVFAGVIGLINGSYTFTSFVQTAAKGIISMEDIAMIAILIGGLIGLIQHYGGIDYILHSIMSKIKTKRGAEFGIAALVSAVDIATVNNTISIIMTGPLAKIIADEYEIDPRKSASILDIFSSAWQGFLPYGGQMLAAAGIAGISPVSLMPYSFYPVLLGVCGIVAILIRYPKFQAQPKELQYKKAQ